MQERQRSLLYLLAAALLWSLGGVLIKAISWHPLSISSLRSAVCALTLMVLLRRLPRRWSSVQIVCALIYAATLTTFVAATKLTTAANAILLQYTAPVYVALFGTWFLREKVHARDILAIVLVLGGMVLFFLDEISISGYWGNLLAILSGLCFAWLVLFLRKQKDGSPVESVLLGNVFTFLLGLPWAFPVQHSLKNWSALLLLGVLQLGVAYFLYSLAIKRVRAIQAILVPTIEPILNPLWVWLALGETPGRWAAVGGMVVIGAVILHSILSLRASRRSG